jgi:hypothetical protein
VGGVARGRDPATRGGGGVKLGGRAATVVAVLAFLAVAGVIGLRTARNRIDPAHPAQPRFGLHDFRDVLYYPSVALREGVNPYDASRFRAAYPVNRAYAPYTPIMPILHLPFTALPLLPAAYLHYAMNLALLFGLAALVLAICRIARTPARVVGLATILLASRPGHLNTFVGQATLFIVIPALVALHGAARHTRWPSLALAVTCAKPTFALPLAAAMLVRRQVRPVVIGLALAAVVGAVGVLLLARAAGGLAPLVASYRDAVALVASDYSAGATTSVIRVDANGLLTHLVGRPLGSAELAVNEPT